MNQLPALIMFFAWQAGFVVAEGFLSSVSALIFPPYAWCLTAEWLMSALQIA